MVPVNGRGFTKKEENKLSVYYRAGMHCEQDKV